MYYRTKASSPEHPKVVLSPLDDKYNHLKNHAPQNSNHLPNILSNLFQLHHFRAPIHDHLAPRSLHRFMTK